MDFIALESPLAPVVMDTMLSYGYYRMRQSLFTTGFTYTDNGGQVEALWARILLDGFTPNHRYRKLARLCSRFTCTLHDAIVTPEIEDLYASYRRHIDFDANDSVAACLLEESGADYFPGRMWQVRDGSELIAAGYFDEGQESAAGILNFYHPEYRKYSLGLWLYFESIRYAAERSKRYFYPGYIAMGYAKFDYKLLAGVAHMELWDPSRAHWMPYLESAHAQQDRLVR